MEYCKISEGAADYARGKTGISVMDQKGIDRINELARKAKTQELTPEEKKEQHKLRKEFIASVRMNLRSQLDNINIQEKDGSITNLGEKYGSKESH